jgi:hypothetical protein
MSSWCCPTTSLTTHLFSLYTPLSLEPYLNCNKYYFYTHESVRLLACLASLPDWSGRGVNLVDIVLFFMLHSNGRWYIIVSQILGNSISTQCPPCANWANSDCRGDHILDYFYFKLEFESNLTLYLIRHGAKELVYVRVHARAFVGSH